MTVLLPALIPHSELTHAAPLWLAHIDEVVAGW